MRKSLLIIVFALLAAFGCGRLSDGGERADLIRIFDSLDSLDTGTPLERSWVSVRGGVNEYYIKSSVPFDVKWQDSGDAWGSVSAPEKIGSGLWKVQLTTAPISKRTLLEGEGFYQKRYGVLLFTSPASYLGSYLKVEQGMTVRHFADFSELKGSLDPNSTRDDHIFSSWTAAQQNLGYSSTPVKDSVAWVYSKEGYVKLGSDTGYGADFIVPEISALQNDTLVVVTFDATVQTGELRPDFEGGTEPILPMNNLRLRKAVAESHDRNVLTVRVTGGGYIRDSLETKGTSITFSDIEPYDRTSATYPYDIFDGKRYVVFIKGTDTNPISPKTRIHFEAGDLSGTPAESCSRIFLDNIVVYRASVFHDEDIFPFMNKSGKDTIL